jgi:hypothetical protein
MNGLENLSVYGFFLLFRFYDMTIGNPYAKMAPPAPQLTLRESSIWGEKHPWLPFNS